MILDVSVALSEIPFCKISKVTLLALSVLFTVVNSLSMSSGAGDQSVATFPFSSFTLLILKGSIAPFNDLTIKISICASGCVWITIFLSFLPGVLGSLAMLVQLSRYTLVVCLPSLS